MGKLSIRVHDCKLLQPSARVEISPRVVVVVDNTYRFRTPVRKRTFTPEYEDTFVVGNTHRLAVIEVSVYDVVESKNLLLQGLKLDGAIGGSGSGGGTLGSSLGHHRGHRDRASRSRSRSPESKRGFLGLFRSKDTDIALGSSSPGNANLDDNSDEEGAGGKATETSLLGRCYISIERLVQGQPKTRTYSLGTPLNSPGSLEEYLGMPPGVTGTIRLTLSSDSLGESPSVLKLDDAREQEYAERLKRFLLRVDRPKIQVLDLILANARDMAEKVKGAHRFAAKQNASMSQKPPIKDEQAGFRLKTSLTVTSSGAVVSGTSVSVNRKFPQLTFNRPPEHETFEELMKRLVSEYGSFESSSFKVMVRVDGCTNLDKKTLNTALLGSDDVYAVIRTESEGYVTCDAKLQNTVVWTEGNEVVLNVVNPGTCVVHVLVMGKSSQKQYEIGRTTFGVATLALEHVSSRDLYLCTFDNVTLPQITGAVHLSVKPLNFGLVPVELVGHIDDYYNRLSKFFQRYDVVRVPQVDRLVRARIGELDEYMQDLIVEHGREPGSVQLLVTVNEIVALQEEMSRELNDKEVRVLITMGGTSVRTRSRKISRFVTTKFNEGYCFDVVRETDLIRLEVVKASDETVVYGRVDFTCLNIQRGVTNEKKLYLVGNAGTANAYVSGIIRFSLFSNEVGKNYRVDEAQGRLFYDRLRRYAFRRMPENLHRVTLAVDMVFDMETFMAQIASRYGEEDPTLAIYFTVIGCRQLKSRFGGVNPYVVVRVGIDSYHTKFVKDNPEADFFEFCEFYIDRPADHFITLIVMDHSDVGDDTEIGRAVISLQDVTIGQQYHDFLPLQPPPSKKRGKKKGIWVPGEVGPRLAFLSNEGEGSRSGRSRGMQDEGSSDTDGDESVSYGVSERDNTYSTAEYYAYRDESMREAKRKPIGSVGFKYVVADMKIVDPTRCRLTRLQAQRDGSHNAPPIRRYEADDVAQARGVQGGNGKSSASLARRTQASLQNSFSEVASRAGGGGDGVVNNTSMTANSTGGVATTGSATARPFGGWMSKFKGFQKALGNLGKAPTSTGDAGASHVDGRNSVLSMPLSAASRDRDGASEGGLSSLESTANVPTVNLMDEGVIDLDAFLSAPVLSNLNSVTNSALDESQEDTDTSEGYTSQGRGGAFRGLPGSDLVTGARRSTSPEGWSGSGSGSAHNSTQSTLARPIRNGGKGVLDNPLTSGVHEQATALAVGATGATRKPARGVEDDDLDQLLVRANTMSNVYDPSTRRGSVNSAYGDDEFGGAGGQQIAMQETGPKFLHLRIVCCKNLLSSGKQKPNPYLLFSTVNETHRTRIEFNTVHPRYNEEFSILIDDPLRDFLHITALTDTPYGSKKLGHCVLSMRNVQRGEWHTRWASLVVNSHSNTAFERGSVCVSLMGESFGLEYLPSTDAENRLRERLRDFLVSKNQAQLHRLEWFVGEYSDQNTDVLTRLFGKYYISTDATQSAELSVHVKRVEQLCLDGGMLFNGNCVVKIKANGKTYAKTRSVAGTEGTFVFDESLNFKLDNPGTAQIRLCVVANGKEKAGESLTSLQDLHRGVEQERRHILSIDARGAHPTPSGYITCSLLSPTFGSSSAPPTADEEARFYRLQRFLYYYKPEEVAMADLRYASTLNVNALLKKLVRHYGPEPGEYHLRLQLQRCLNMHFVHSNKTTHPFAVVRCGMKEQRTSIVEGHQECVFYESFDLEVGLPDRERVEIILFDFTPARCTEIGRTQVPLTTLTRGQPNDLRLPLVRDAGTRYAEVNGLVELQAFTEDFGRPAHTRSQSSAWFYPDDGSGTQPGSGGPHSATATHTGVNTPISVSGKRKGRSGSNPDNTTSVFDGFHHRRTKSHGTPQDHSQIGSVDRDHPSPGSPTLGLSPSNTNNNNNSSAASAGRTGGATSNPSSRPPATGGTVQLKPRDPNHTGALVKVSITGFLGFKTQDLELYIRVTSKNDTLVKTKPIPVPELASLKEPVTFEVDDQALYTDRIFTVKLGENGLLSKEAVCYADFCLTRCTPGKVTEKRLRLYQCKTNDFLGICRLKVDVPANASEFDQGTDRDAVLTTVAEPIIDDVASLVTKYSPKDLRKLDLSFFRSADVRRLHRALRLQLCPSVVATVYVAIHDINLNLTTGPTSFVFKHSCTVSATCGAYTAEVVKRTALLASGTSSSIFPYGMSRPGIGTLDFCPLRVDITPTGPDAVLTLCVHDRQSRTKVTEVGRTVVSLRALLTPQVYSVGEKVTVPLVEQRRASNRVHASLLGSVTFSVYPPAYETYPSSLCFSPNEVSDFNREYMRYYTGRVYRLLKNYDANSLVDLHAKMYEKFVPGHAWEAGLPNFLASLVERWGPELEPSGPVPQLRR